MSAYTPANEPSPVTQAILDGRVLPLFFQPDVSLALRIARALLDGGAPALELTHRGPQAPEVFAAVRAQHPTDLLGAGTVLDAVTAQLYCDAGADFLVSPCWIATVADVANAHHVPYYPGAQTVLEVWTAWSAGAQLIKIFPGDVLTPAFVKALRGPLPHIPVLISGGVQATQTSVQQWREAGADVLGLGSRLVPQEAGDLNEAALKVRIQQVLQWARGAG